MPLVAKSTRASIDTSAGFFSQTYAGGIAGATLPALTACKVNADGTVGLAAGTDAIIGVNARDALAGEPVTLFGYATRAKYADGTLTPGGLLYVGASGALYTSTAAGEGTGAAVAVALTTSDLLIVRTI